MKNLKQVIDQTDWDLLQQQKLILLSHAQNEVGNHTRPALDGILNFLDAIQDAVVNDDLVKEEVMFPTAQ